MFEKKIESFSYPGKLLLFGEYVLLLGAPALAVPARAYAASWVNDPTLPVGALYEFSRYPMLESILGASATVQFQAEIADGWRLKSAIPQGYGMGSSGALCAGVYDRYSAEKSTDLAQLKQIFAQMEHYFHGNSSGLDPLTSYLNQPIWVEQADQIRIFEEKPWENGPQVFLIDSHLPRQTAPLVQWFLTQQQTAAFDSQLKSELLPAHMDTLDAWVEQDATRFWRGLRALSEVQFRCLSPMIPDTLRNMWSESLTQNAYHLKICGAGGGGYILGFARNERTIVELKKRFLVTLPFQTGIVA